MGPLTAPNSHIGAQEGAIVALSPLNALVLKQKPKTRGKAIRYFCLWCQGWAGPGRATARGRRWATSLPKEPGAGGNRRFGTGQSLCGDLPTDIVPAPPVGRCWVLCGPLGPAAAGGVATPGQRGGPEFQPAQ